MKFKLSVLDRLVLLNTVIPSQGSAIDLLAAETLRETIKFTKEEQAELDFKGPGDKRISEDGTEEEVQGISWNADPDSAIIRTEFDIIIKEVELIAKNLRRLSDKEQLTTAHLPLWKKFVEEPKADGKKGPL